MWRPVLRQDPYKLEVAKHRVRDLLDNRGATEEILKQLEIVKRHTPRENWADNLFMGVAYFALGEKDRGIKCVEPNVDFGYETEVSSPVLRSMRQGKLDPSALTEELKDLVVKAERAERLNIPIQDKEAASALTDYFEGRGKKAAEALERLTESSRNPAVFHALRLIAYSRLPRDWAEIDRLEKRERALRIDENAGRAYTELLPLAEGYAAQGSSAAQVFLGDMYQEGRGVERDLQKALSLFTKPAEAGDAYAQGSMGAVYYSLEDYEKAAEWSTKAAEQGLAEAQNYLGNMYYSGKGVPQDYKKAAEWYTKAAEQGLAEAQNYLGNMYGNGKGVPQDYRRAAEWYTKVADQGYHWGQYNLGDLYCRGKGVPEDCKKAEAWYIKAANQGNDGAQYALGELYMKAEKLKEAYQWYYLAHLNGNKDAQGALDKIEGKGWLWDSDPQIPTAQIEQARAEARKMYEEQKKRSAQ